MSCPPNVLRMCCLLLSCHGLLVLPGLMWVTSPGVLLTAAAAAAVMVLWCCLLWAELWVVLLLLRLLFWLRRLSVVDSTLVLPARSLWWGVGRYSLMSQQGRSLSRVRGTACVVVGS